MRFELTTEPWESKVSNDASAPFTLYSVPPTLRALCASVFQKSQRGACSPSVDTESSSLNHRLSIQSVWQSPTGQIGRIIQARKEPVLIQSPG